jgi:hypothetical protein
MIIEVKLENEIFIAVVTHIKSITVAQIDILL